MSKVASGKGEEQEVELYLPKFDSEETAKGLDDVFERFPASIDKITGWFKNYQVDSIELSISGVIETGTLISLVVSAKGEGGMKVVLKPKSRDSE